MRGRPFDFDSRVQEFETGLLSELLERDGGVTRGNVERLFDGELRRSHRDRTAKQNEHD
ncbi:MAG TPA: hypothetical protein PLN52_13905 [Opitutaceae bacterium]|nr:hypothetical protein [Opitutaceae bacterium]